MEQESAIAMVVAAEKDSYVYVLTINYFNLKVLFSNDIYPEKE